MFKKAKESCETHQSKTHVDCESNTSDNEKEENNSDMDNNSVMLRNKSNKGCSEFIVSQETNPAVQNYSKSNKIAILDFSKAEGVIRFNSDYFAIEQHVLAEKSLCRENVKLSKNLAMEARKEHWHVNTRWFPVALGALI